MSWKRQTDITPINKTINKILDKNKPIDNGNSSHLSNEKFNNFYAEHYAGSPQRIQRYQQYDDMELEPTIFASLDTIADFCTRTIEDTDEIFEIITDENTDSDEKLVLRAALKQWVSLNDFKKRIWKIFRNTIKYGDSFFIRDPETLKWIDVSPSQITDIVVDKSKGREFQYYLIKDLDLYLQSLTMNSPNNNPYTGRSAQSGINTTTNTGQWSSKSNTHAVKALHVIHLTLNNSVVDMNWPFGTSVLDAAMKIYRQKEMISEAVLIYRIVRAPERRVFYIDVGNMPAHKAQEYLERMKNEMAQRRFPSRNGGTNDYLNTSYNTMSMTEDFYIAQTAEGRGGRIDTLQGGENLGQVDDLKLWKNELAKAMQVPISYLPSGPDDASSQYNDGRMGTAYMQEYRFARYCARLQMMLSDVFDSEFKLFLKQREINISASQFNIRFVQPMDFRYWEQLEKDSTRIQMFQTINDLKYISKRFALKRFLGLTDAEIELNEKYYLEENPHHNVKQDNDSSSTSLNSLGIKPDTNMDFDDMNLNDTTPDTKPNEGIDETPPVENNDLDI